MIQDLKFDKESESHILDLPKTVDVGKYVFVFEVSLSADLFLIETLCFTLAFIWF